MEILSGNLTLKKALMSRKNFCQLIGTLGACHEAPAGSGSRPAYVPDHKPVDYTQMVRIVLLMMHYKGKRERSSGSGRAISMAEVSSVTRDRKAPTRVILQVGQRQMRFSAATAEEGASWFAALRSAHDQIERQSAQQNDATGARVSAAL